MNYIKFKEALSHIEKGLNILSAYEDVGDIKVSYVLIEEELELLKEYIHTDNHIFYFKDRKTLEDI